MKTIVVAPDSFKESLSAAEACAAIAEGIREACPPAVVESIPMADGGEGTVEAMVRATGGRFVETLVDGPLGEPVRARWGILGGEGSTAVIEMAAASGLALVPPDRRNPLLTTTYGTGQLIAAAMQAGVARIIAGIGGSATVDGGAGAAAAVGFRFLREDGTALNSHVGGGELGHIARIERPAAFDAITRTAIEVACDVTNPLCGPSGAAAVFGPQKGATPQQVELLDRNLAHLADVIEREWGIAIRDLPGAGAAGGLGGGMVAFFAAKLRRGVELVMDAVRFRERIRGADLIITGEGRLDAQSMMGKVIAGVGAAGREAGVPVVALAGIIGEGAQKAEAVLESYHAIAPTGLPREESMRRAPELLREAAARLVRERMRQ